MWAIILFCILSYLILSYILVIQILQFSFLYLHVIFKLPSPFALFALLLIHVTRISYSVIRYISSFTYSTLWLPPFSLSLPSSLPSFPPSLPAFITFTSSLSLHSFLPFHSSLPFLPFLSPTILFLLPSLPPYLSLSFRPFLHLPLILYSADPGSHQNVFTMRLVEEFSMSAKYAKILDLPDFPR